MRQKRDKRAMDILLQNGSPYKVTVLPYQCKQWSGADVFGMTLSAEKSFWMTLGCSIDESDREAIQLPCGSVKYTGSFKYLGVELTSDLADTADIDAKLSRGRSTFTSLSKVFCSSVLSVKLREAIPDTNHTDCVTWMRVLDTVSCCVWQAECISVPLSSNHTGS